MQIPNSGNTTREIQEMTKALIDDLILNVDASDIDHLRSTINAGLKHLRPTHENPEAIIAATFLAYDDDAEENDEMLTLAFHHFYRHLEAAGRFLQQQNRRYTQLENHCGMGGECCHKIVDESCVRGRAICLAKEPRIYLVPRHAQKGDIVTLFRGGPTLYVIRPTGTAHEYLYIGDAYPYRLMDGEILETPGWEERVEEFTLV